MQRRSAHKKSVSGPWRFTLGCGAFVLILASGYSFGCGVPAPIEFGETEGCVATDVKLDGNPAELEKNIDSRAGFHKVEATLNGKKQKFWFHADPISMGAYVEFYCNPPQIVVHQT